MTLADFQQLFKDIREAIVDVVESSVDVNKTKILARDAYHDDDTIWLGRITAPDDSIHCWSIFYTGCAGLDDPQNPVATETFVPMFRLIGYYGYDFGTDAANSTDKFQDELQALRWNFMNNATLGMGTPVNFHTGFKDQTVLGKISDRRIHIARVDMGVELTPIPYTYQ